MGQIFLPVGVRHVHQQPALGQHVQIAVGAVLHHGLVHEALAVVAEARPRAAERETRHAVDACSLAGAGAALHGAAGPHAHADAGAVAAHTADHGGVGSIIAVRPGQVAHLVGQVEAHVGVAAEIARRHDRRLRVDLMVRAIDIPEDGPGHRIALFHEHHALVAPLDGAAGLFKRRMHRTDDERPHVDVRLLVAPLRHGRPRLLAAALAAEVVVALVVGGLGVLLHVLGRDALHHPVEHLAGAHGVVANKFLVRMAAREAHVLVEHFGGVDLGRALVQEQLRVVAGHVAGVLVVFVVGLHLGEEHLRARLLAAQRRHRAGVARPDDQHVAFLDVGDVGDLGSVAKPCRLVQHEIGGLDVQLLTPAASRQHAVAFECNVLLGRGGRLRIGVLAAVERRQLLHHIVRASLARPRLGSRPRRRRLLRRAASQRAKRGNAHRTRGRALQEVATRPAALRVLRGCSHVPSPFVFDAERVLRRLPSRFRLCCTAPDVRLHYDATRSFAITESDDFKVREGARVIKLYS